MTSAAVLRRNLEQLAHPCSAADVVHVLLVFTRSQMAEWTKTISAPGGREAYDEARDVAGGYLKGFRGPTMSAADVAKIGAFADELAKRVKSALLAARAMALALDEVSGHTFGGAFRAKSRVTLTADAAFPVRKHEQDFWGPAPDATPRLKLFPRSGPSVPVVLSFEHASALQGIPVDARVAALLPNVAPKTTPAANTLDAIRAGFDITVDVVGSKFFFVQTTNVDQVDRVKKLVELAEQQQVDLALLPELCLTEAQQDELTGWLNGRITTLRFLTIGSAHCEGGMRRTNRARSFVTKDLALVHEKFNPYWFGKTLEEDLRGADGGVTIYALSDLRKLVVLVCKDLLAANIATLLAEMRVWLALVPSLSPKADDFQTVAGILATKGQTSLLAAITSFGDPSEAVVVAGRPRKAAGTNLPVHKSRAEVGQPALVTTRLAVAEFSVDNQELTLITHPL